MNRSARILAISKNYFFQKFRMMGNAPFPISNLYQNKAQCQSQTQPNINPIDSSKLRIALVAKLRKDHECSISKAKEALSRCDFDYQKASNLLFTEMELAAKKKAVKLASRIASEGLIGVVSHPLGIYACVVEVNCETDFVAKSEPFCTLVLSIAITAALHQEAHPQGLIQSISMENLLERRLITNLATEETVHEGCTKAVGKLGENIKPRRGLAGVQNDTGSLIFGAYAHSAGHLVPSGLGRMGAIVALSASSSENLNSARNNLAILARKIAQHITGFDPCSINGSENSLLDQQFLFGGGSVREVLAQESDKLKVELKIEEFQRLVCGQGIEKPLTDFAKDVQKQLST